MLPADGNLVSARAACMHAGCSLVGMVDACLEQDLGTFKASCQDMVDQLEELRRRCAVAAHRAPITRLLFIITRCSPPRLHRSPAAPSLSSCLPHARSMLSSRAWCSPTASISWLLLR